MLFKIYVCFILTTAAMAGFKTPYIKYANT